MTASTSCGAAHAGPAPSLWTHPAAGMKFGRLLEADTDEAFRAHYLRCVRVRGAVMQLAAAASSDLPRAPKHVDALLTCRHCNPVPVWLCRYNALKAVLKSVTPGAASTATDDAAHIRSTINRRLTPSLSDMNSVRGICGVVLPAWSLTEHTALLQLMRSNPESQFQEMLEDDMQRVGRFVAAQKEDLHLRARAMVSRAALASSASEINKLEGMRCVWTRTYAITPPHSSPPRHSLCGRTGSSGGEAGPVCATQLHRLCEDREEARPPHRPQHTALAVDAPVGGRVVHAAAVRHHGDFAE